jgi:hypothetical protein
MPDLRLGYGLHVYHDRVEKWFRQAVSKWQREGGNPFEPIPAFPFTLETSEALHKRMQTILPSLRRQAWAYERECRMRVYRGHVPCKNDLDHGWRPEDFYVPRPRKVPTQGFVSSTRRTNAMQWQWSIQWGLPCVYHRPRHGWQADIWLISPTTAA